MLHEKYWDIKVVAKIYTSCKKQYLIGMTYE